MSSLGLIRFMQIDAVSMPVSRSTGSQISLSDVIRSDWVDIFRFCWHSRVPVAELHSHHQRRCHLVRLNAALVGKTAYL